MLGLTAALLIISTPQTVVTIPKPETSMKHAAQFINWSARAQMSTKPKRLRGLLSPLRVDPFEPTTYKQLGLSSDEPIRLWIADEPTTRIMEFEVEKKKAFDQTISSILKTDKRTREITEANGLWYSPKPGVFVAALRVRGRAYLLLNRKAGSSAMRGAVTLFKNLLKAKPTSDRVKLEAISLQDKRLDFIHSIKNHPRPKYPKQSEASFWVHQLDNSQVYASSPIYATNEKIRFEASFASTHFQSRQQSLGWLKERSRPRKLFATQEIAKVAAEARVHLRPQALTKWGEKQGLMVELDRLFSGLVHAVLMQDGAVMVAATLHKKTTTKLQKKIAKELQALFPKMNLLKVKGYRNEDVWLMWWGDVSKESIKRLFMDSKPEFMDANHFSTQPDALLKALRNRSVKTDGLRMTGAQMLIVDLAFSEIMRSTKSATANLMVLPKKSRLFLEIEY